VTTSSDELKPSMFPSDWFSCKPQAYRGDSGRACPAIGGPIALLRILPENIFPELIIAGWRIAPRCIGDGCVLGCQLASIRVFGLRGKRYIYTCVCGIVAW
jgi:hypothetical protein